jgi:hypothetical protein
MGVAAIKNAGEAWTISGNTFEPLASMQAGGLVQEAEVNAFALTLVGNWFGDVRETGGTYVDIRGSVYGFAAINNRFATTCVCAGTKPCTECDACVAGCNGDPDCIARCRQSAACVECQACIERCLAARDASIRLAGGQGAVIIGNRFETSIGVDFSVPNFLGAFVGGNDFQDLHTPIQGVETVPRMAAFGNNILPNFVGVSHFVGVGTTSPEVPLDVQASARLGASGSPLGFFGATPTGQPTVAGSKDDSTALASLIAALASLGLLRDQTTGQVAGRDGPGVPSAAVEEGGR